MMKYRILIIIILILLVLTFNVYSNTSTYKNYAIAGLSTFYAGLGLELIGSSIIISGSIEFVPELFLIGGGILIVGSIAEAIVGPYLSSIAYNQIPDRDGDDYKSNTDFWFGISYLNIIGGLVGTGFIFAGFICGEYSKIIGSIILTICSITAVSMRATAVTIPLLYYKI